MSWRTAINVLSDLPTEKLWIAFWTFGVGFSVMFWCVLHPIDKQLVYLQKKKHPEPADPPKRSAYGIFDLQMFFAYGPGAKNILDQWDDEERRLARQSLVFDFAMMPTYAFFLAAFFLLLAKGVHEDWKPVLICLALCPLAAWLCDIVENVMGLRLLETPRGSEPSAACLAVAGIATAGKWLLMIVPVLPGVVIWLVRRRRQDKPPLVS